MRFKNIKKYLENPANVRKAEWRLVTLLYLSMILFLLIEADLNDTHKADFDRVKWPFYYYNHFFFPSLARYTVSYLTFLLVVGIGLYSAIKLTVVYLASRNEAEKRSHRTFTKDMLSVLVLWIISLILLLFAGADDEVLIGWSLIVLTAIPIYSFAFYRSIPILFGRKQAFLVYLFQIGLVIAAANLLIGLLLMQVLGQAEAALNYTLFNAAFQLALTAPLASKPSSICNASRFT